MRQDTPRSLRVVSATAGGCGIEPRVSVLTSVVARCGIKPPFVPTIKSPIDASNFDDFEDMENEFQVEPTDTSGHFLQFFCEV